MLQSTGRCPRWLIREAVLRAVAMEQLFEKPFVGEGRQIISGAQLVHDGHRHAPGHPFARRVAQVPAASEEAFDDFDLGFGEKAQVGCELGRFERAAERRIADGRGKDLIEGGRFGLALAHNDRSGDHVADALIPLVDENADQPYGVERWGHHVEGAQQISDSRFPERDGTSILAYDAQFEPALPRRLPVPQPLEEDEVTRQDEENQDDEQSLDPLRGLYKLSAQASVVADNAEGDDDQGEDHGLQRVIDRAGEKAVADGSQREVQRDALRRLNHQRLFGRNRSFGRHHKAIAECGFRIAELKKGGSSFNPQSEIRIPQFSQLCGLANVSPPSKSIKTKGSSPTTQASCPAGTTPTSPARHSISVPSFIFIFMRPDTTYHLCETSQLSVPATGLTHSDQLHPGSKVARITERPLTSTTSARPFSNGRVSSGLSKFCLMLVFSPTAIDSSPSKVIRALIARLRRFYRKSRGPSTSTSPVR